MSANNGPHNQAVPGPATGSIAGVPITAESSGMRMIAWAQVTALGVVRSSFGFASCVRNVAGQYTLETEAEFIGDDAVCSITPCIEELIPFGSPAFLFDSRSSTTTVDVAMRDATGALADRAFNIIVWTTTRRQEG